MAIADKFLTEAEIGVLVSVMVGSKEIVGSITSLDDTTVQIRKDDGNTPTISIESISYYEILKNNPNTENEIETKLQIDKRSSMVFTKLAERGDCFFIDVNVPSVKTYSDIATSSTTSNKEHLKSINNSLNYAINQTHESNPGDYKIKENISKLRKIIRQPGFRTKIEASNMLGALYYQLGSERSALTEYLNGDDYVSAFAVAHKINSLEEMRLFACAHLIQNRVFDHYVIKWLTSDMIKNNDYSIFSEIKPESIDEVTLSGVVSVAKSVVLANDINYDSSIDKEATVSTFDQLIKLINQYNLSKNSKLLENYKKWKYKKEQQLITPSVISKKKTVIDSATNNYLSYDNTSFFRLAQNAEQTEKNKRKAIEYYKEAIKNGDHISESINCLITIFINQEMYDQALALLDVEGVKNLGYTDYLKLKISVLSGVKNPKYKWEIKNTYKEALYNFQIRFDEKSDLKLDEAYKMIEIGEYSESIYLFKSCLEILNTHPFYVDHPESREKRLVRTYDGLCNAHLKLNNLDAAKKFAQEIVKISPEDEHALSIIRGEDIGDFITSGMSGISNYIKQRIDKINLESELRNNTSIINGIYRGNPYQAIKIIDAIKGDQVKNSVNDEVKSNYYFAIAKIIRQIIDREEDERLTISTQDRINERKFQVYAAIGIFFYGNYRILRSESTHKGIDSARYCLFEAFAMFNDSETSHICWAAATVRFIQSFYFSESELKTNHARLYAKFEKDGYDDYVMIIKEIMQNKLCVPTDEFVIGMIEMLSYNFRVRELVFDNVWCMTNLRNDVEGILNSIIDENNEISSDKTEFINKWNQASRKYDIGRKEYMRLISETIESVFVVGEFQNNYDRLANDGFSRYLNSTDRDTVEKLKEIFLLLIRYNEISEFDYKADTLVRANEICKRLEEKVSDNPTYLGYEKILPALAQLQARIIEESTSLYSNSQPVITVEISGDCSVDGENEVLVPIAFTNKKNVQSADNVSIRIEGEKVKIVNDEQLSRILLTGNGIALEKMVELKVDPIILEEQVFSVNIEIQYQYRTSMTETQIAEIEIPLSVPLYSTSTFRPIENKFEPYRSGSAVKEPSMFYGRDKEIQSIIEQICDDHGNVLRGRCLALYGQTRTGKSSLLFHLERKLREIDKESNIIVNIGSIGEENLYDNDITEFLYTILFELNREITTKHEKLNKICKDADFVIDANRLLDNPQRSQLYFNDAFKKLNSLIEEHKLNYNIIIMIDEFTYIYDWIRKGTMTDRIMKFWKAFIQNNGVFAVIIGQDHMMKFVEEKQFTNDFGSTDLRKVTYLPEESAKKLMYEPILLVDENGNSINRYKEGALDRLYDLTAGSAFLIMNLCAGLVDYLNKMHSVFITRAHIDDYLKKNMGSFEEARFFEPQYNDKSEINSSEINEENKRLLKRIAQLSNNKEWTSLSSVITNEHDRELLKALEQRDVIIVSNNERCKIKVGLYKEWIIEKYGMEV